MKTFSQKLFNATCLLRMFVFGEVFQIYVTDKVGGWSLMTRTGRWQLLTPQSGSEPAGQAPGLYLTRTLHTLLLVNSLILAKPRSVTPSFAGF